MPRATWSRSWTGGWPATRRADRTWWRARGADVVAVAAPLARDGVAFGEQRPGSRAGCERGGRRSRAPSRSTGSRVPTRRPWTRLRVVPGVGRPGQVVPVARRRAGAGAGGGPDARGRGCDTLAGPPRDRRRGAGRSWSGPSRCGSRRVSPWSPPPGPGRGAPDGELPAGPMARLLGVRSSMRRSVRGCPRRCWCAVCSPLPSTAERGRPASIGSMSELRPSSPVRRPEDAPTSRPPTSTSTPDPVAGRRRRPAWSPRPPTSWCASSATWPACRCTSGATVDAGRRTGRADGPPARRRQLPSTTRRCPAGRPAPGAPPWTGSPTSCVSEGNWPSLLLADRLDRPPGLDEAHGRRSAGDGSWARRCCGWATRRSCRTWTRGFGSRRSSRVRSWTTTRPWSGRSSASTRPRGGAPPRAGRCARDAAGCVPSWCVWTASPSRSRALSQGEGVAGIYALGVARAWRGRGYGTLLTTIATRAGMATGNRIVWLSVEDGNDAGPARLRQARVPARLRLVALAGARGLTSDRARTDRRLAAYGPGPRPPGSPCIMAARRRLHGRSRPAPCRADPVRLGLAATRARLADSPSAAAYSSMPVAPRRTRTAASSSTSCASSRDPQASSTRRTAWAANRSTWAVSGRRGSSQNQPQLANMASRDAWACIRVSSSRPRRGVTDAAARPRQLVRDPGLGVRRSRWPRPRTGRGTPRRRGPARASARLGDARRCRRPGGRTPGAGAPSSGRRRRSRIRAHQRATPWWQDQLVRSAIVRRGQVVRVERAQPRTRAW